MRYDCKKIAGLSWWSFSIYRQSAAIQTYSLSHKSSCSAAQKNGQNSRFLSVFYTLPVKRAGDMAATIGRLQPVQAGIIMSENSETFFEYMLE